MTINNTLGNINLDALGIRSTQNAQAQESNDLDKDAFLRLLITQLENQNPLEPQENGEFLSQLAQFSTLEGIDTMATNVESLVSSFNSNRALQASSLVGLTALIDANAAPLTEKGEVRGEIELPASVGDLAITVKDSAGNLVRKLDLGVQAAGTIGFAWDGTNADGDTVPTGTYSFEAEALIDGESTALNIALGFNIESVSLGNAGQTATLNLAGNSSIALSDVKQIAK